MIDTLLNIFGVLIQPDNLVLIIVLILAFVVGFKVLKTITTLVIVSIVSGVFFVLMNYTGLVSLQVNISNVLGFMFLGLLLYIVFFSIQMATGIVKTVVDIVTKLGHTILFPFKKLFAAAKSKKKEMEKKEKKKKQKSVVLEESDD